MCGIVGALTNRYAAPLIFDMLTRMEYRGYDSAGIAVLDDGRLQRRRSAGKLKSLGALLQANPLNGASGIGHTRWATHGSPSEANAHPHVCGDVAVVHNGIIENYAQLRAELTAEGWEFGSDTDTEVIAVLCASMMRRGLSREDAAAATFSRLEGAFALCFLFEGAEDLMICARRGSPLVIGYGEEECFVGSDAIALAPITQHITYLEEGDWAILRRTEVRIYDGNGNPVERATQHVKPHEFMADKGQYRHFMAKEIHEQPSAISRTIRPWIRPDLDTSTALNEQIDWQTTSRISIIGCGSAYLAGHAGKVWIESLARLPVDCEIASEFRYRMPPLPEDGLVLVISQSGETADTLAALRFAKEKKQKTIALVNTPNSSIAREADVVLLTDAGPEIGVASTKAFTSQLAVMAAIAIQVANAKGASSDDDLQKHFQMLTSAPRLMAETLALEPQLRAVAQEISHADSALFLGRGFMYPIALEGALKLKEISYMHAEGYAAGELKHGPIALIDEAMPIIALAPSDALYGKTTSNLSEVMARNGRVFLLSDADGCSAFKDGPEMAVALPTVDPFLSPFVYSVAIQLIAYHTAAIKGTDVDQPRNLAKSVTVE